MIRNMKVTLITGASGGIGEAFARHLAAQKHHLLLVARSENRLQLLCKELSVEYGIAAQYVATDLAEAGSDGLIAAEVAKRGMEVNWLINNAGIGTGGDLLEYSLEDYRNLMHLNMDALVALTYRFLPQMRAAKSGTIINVGSMAGFGPVPYMGIYAASKAFVRSFTEALWEENRPYHVRTMLLCPGVTETGFFDAARIGSDRQRSYSTSIKETPEQVVAAAMKGLKQGKIITVSGFHNKLGRAVISIAPEKPVLKLWGNKMRKELKLEIR